MTQSAAPLTAHVANAFRTLGLLYLRSEQHVSRGAPRVVLRTREKAGEGWVDVPAWRFFRHVVRAGLYLRERCKLQAGERVLVVAPLRAERILAEWAVVAQGGVVASVDPGMADEALRGALASLTPRVAFVADAATRERVQRLGTSVQRAVVIEGPARVDSSDVTWSQMIDLGGTLDTAERAQSFRAGARALRPEMPAIAYLDLEAAGGPAWATASHAAVAERIADLWKSEPPRAGDVAYVVDPGEYPGLRLALWALVADSEITVALGTAQRQEQDAGDVGATVVVAPPEVLEAASRVQRAARGDASRRVAQWLQKAGRLAPLARPLAARLFGSQREDTAPQSRRALTLEGSSWPVTLPIAQR
jgi:acyl-CoA synthetase (AMP-forming)/AMP-acid ligase II